MPLVNWHQRCDADDGEKEAREQNVKMASFFVIKSIFEIS